VSSCTVANSLVGASPKQTRRHLLYSPYLQVVRATPNNSTKTPLSLLNEFAARLCLDVVFTEEADAQAGPFTVTAALQGRGGAAGYIHAKGTGKVGGYHANGGAIVKRA
jgi:hypothetical protein